MDGEVVGHVHVFARRLVLAGATARCAGIGNVAVAATHRGRRLARPLLEACLEECAAEGYEVALLSTHLRGLYERFGFEVVPSFDARLPVSGDGGWREVEDLTDEDRELYQQEHGGRPGTFVRDDGYWIARNSWLFAEGWRVARHSEFDGYCYLRPGEGRGVVDEAVGGCARRLLEGAPAKETRSWRAPQSFARGLPLQPPEDEFNMVLAFDTGLDLTGLTSPEAVIWRTDGF